MERATGIERSSYSSDLHEITKDMIQGEAIPSTGRVEQWRHTRRFGLSVPPRFLWECLNNRTVAGFHSPPRRTERADFPHSALLLASQEDLWDVANWKCCQNADFSPASTPHPPITSVFLF